MQIEIIIFFYIWMDTGFSQSCLQLYIAINLWNTGNYISSLELLI